MQDSQDNTFPIPAAGDGTNDQAGSVNPPASDGQGLGFNPAPPPGNIVNPQQPTDSSQPPVAPDWTNQATADAAQLPTGGVDDYSINTASQPVQSPQPLQPANPMSDPSSGLPLSPAPAADPNVSAYPPVNTDAGIPPTPIPPDPLMDPNQAYQQPVVPVQPDPSAIPQQQPVYDPNAMQPAAAVPQANTLDLSSQPLGTMQPGVEIAPQMGKPPKTKPRRKKIIKILVLIILLGFMVAGIYILLLLTAPKLLPALENKSNQANVDVIAQNKLIIEDIQVNADIREGDASVLDKGMWHRLPEAGNPEKGGNFILSGHRFKIAATPAEVRDASVLYDIDKLNVGSKIVVHWNGRKYNYTVTKRYKVKPNQVEIEKSTETRMTLYTCTLGGAYDGREVVEASIVE